jgi:probable DNA repair protein
MNTELLRLLTQGYVLITPTSRLARYLQYQYAATQIHAGKVAWETPDIIPWNAWLQRTWGDLAVQHHLDQALLSPQQQQLIWQEIISKSAYAGQLLQPVNTAGQAMLAWQLCQQWEITVFPENAYINEDAFAFRQWARAYQQHCRDNHWFDGATLPAQLINIATSIAKDGKFVLAGFDEFTPQQKSLVNKLKESGCIVQEHPLQKRNTHTIAQAFTDTREEIRAAALWARKQIEADETGNIGIIVHNLQALHSQIENIFDDVLLPGATLVNVETQPRPFSISLGRPLHRYPVIDTAMTILGMGNSSMLMGEFSSLLRSPFIKDVDKESQQRAKLDACLCKYGDYKVSFNTLHWLITNEYIKLQDVPVEFIQACDEYRNIFRSSDKKQSAGEWAKIFSRLLKVFNWPGTRVLNSAEYQTVAEWQNLLNEFASLDLVSRALTYREALTQLRQLVMNTRFQPETPEAPIQILGMTGAAGMQFDHLWVMGLHEENWPPNAEPNPFIPVKLQRDLQMPDASAENKLAQAKNLLQRLIDSSPDVILGYPLNEKDRPLRPSPLLKPWLQSEPLQFDHDAYNYPMQIYSARQTGLIEDNRAPAIPSGKAVSGGAALFKDQAACPFRAFAKHRLFAEGLKSKDIGLDAMDRGSIIHDVMEQLWSRLGSHANLTASAESELDKLINETVSNTINEYQKKYPLTFTVRFTQLETGRLKTLINEYLILERERQPFTVTESERWHQFTFNNIEIRTRIDRIDQLADGRYVIMDYKTGDPKIHAWFDERPDEPQLPFYAITSEGEIAAIVFVKLKRGESAYVGLAQDDDLLPNVTTVNNTRGIKVNVPDWETLFVQWKDTLNRLAINFREGDARVDPKNADSCRYCDLHAFCRIYEKKSGVRI